MTINIDSHYALDLLRQEVRGHEDYVYDEKENSFCHYIKDDRPSCLIGRALHQAGVPIYVLTKLDELGAISQASTVEHLAVNHVHMTAEAQRVFSVAQDLQDADRPWGNALAAAHNTYARLCENEEAVSA
ncbi:hypothetical protein [Phytoactinopolyspora halophila]|uniref:hypothetical protein n=1 Tax=Phytoactinopolyspora halophila TaxID=1981511 RepID=UPI000F4E8559|nr:hypothetical protein [Phytoactinopolyspora halophila]